MGEILGFLVALVIARPADRDVHVGAQVAVLHVAVAGAEIAQDLAQLDDVGGSFLGAPDIGTGDDFHQRHAGAVEIDEGHVGVHVVDRLAGVLFEVDALDAHPARHARPHVDDHLALADDRVVELRNLVALRQVGVEVILAVEGGDQIDLGLQTQPGAHRLLDAIVVDHRQHPRHRRVDEGDVGVGLGAEGGRGAREQLGVGRDLGMHLHADHQFPIFLGSGDLRGLRGFECEMVEHGLSSCGVWGFLGQGGDGSKAPAMGRTLPILCGSMQKTCPKGGNRSLGGGRITPGIVK